ncbi:asparaginase [Caenimonas koreensis]|uniref:Asparaginase n=1 Tax=Caenimonas koreensis DSM 17982 TaxID=1121255 RepID=A0A844BBU3_9BURK|nr:asparaginase [Caenimonas koreensis]MRD49089.1 asparaginase [Caenimonas koreensis DSM 17982]
MTSLVPLIDTFRGGTLECRHFGAVAVVDTQGKLVAQAGDPHWVSFSRSALKALQALPFVRGGGPKLFNFTPENVALMCSSHSGEPMHVTQVQAMLDKANVPAKALQCGCHMPYYVEAGIAPPPDVIDERHNNCSGKHAGFLAHCVQHGWPLNNYLAPAHSLQQAIRRDVARVVGMESDALKLGIDGCSAPNFAMPLSALARGYARLASGAADSEFGESFVQLAEAMTSHPDLVSGSARSDQAFMRAGRGDWVTKAGADGIQAVGSKSRGQAFVVKISDGNKMAVQAATVAVLDQLGWLDARQKDELRAWRFEAIANAKGTRVGERKSAFTLERPR